MTISTTARNGGKGLIVPNQSFPNQPWWASGTALEIRPDAFYDARGTGIGDFQGIKEKLPEIARQHYNAIWLTPFLKSPRKDGGYDISDFRAVDPIYGTLEDLIELVEEAHRLGLKVIMDWVPCHTSDQHPWFKASCSNPHGPYGDFYIWSKTGDENVFYFDADGQLRDVRNILVDDPEPRTVLARIGRKMKRIPANCWAWNPVRRAWNWHRFYSFQPALNYNNPAVEKANLDNMKWWMRVVGIDGFRMDATPFLYVVPGTSHENVPQVRSWVKRNGAALREEFPEAMLLTETDLPEEETPAYLEEGMFDGAFDFRLRVALFLMFALGDASPVLHLLATRPRLRLGASYWKHKGNHDDLRGQWKQWRLSTQEILEILRGTYADGVRGEPFLGDAVVGNFAQMFRWDHQEMWIFLLAQMAFPGIMLDYYADMIGMGHHPLLARGSGPTGDRREGVRTPMQWNAGPNAGFSTADPGSLYLPVIDSGRGDYKILNYESEQANPLSWLNRSAKARELTKRYPLLGFGDAAPLFGFGVPTLGSNEPIRQFGIVRSLEGHSRAMICVFNLAGDAMPFSTELPSHLSQFSGSKVLDAFGGATITRLDGRRLDIVLPPKGGYILEIGCA
jgi:maltose alpha-D-glucosyltransferase/alpha-amylase